MDNNKGSLGEKLVNTGLIILSVLFKIFIIITVSGLVMMFNYLFWGLTFLLVMDKYFISVFFVGALTICFTIASVVGMLVFITWLFRDKDKDEVYWR